MKKENIPYKSFPKFVLRAPLLEFKFFAQLTKDDVITNKLLKYYFDYEIIKEAIFIASPTLYNELEKWLGRGIEPRNEVKLRLSFIKYLIRMSTRCTPFGLFAGYTLGNIENMTKIRLKEYKSYKRYTRADMNYLVEFSQNLAKNNILGQQLKYYPNSSIYESGNHYRYIEYFYVKGVRHHQIVEIDYSIYLDKILKFSERGSTLTSLTNLIVDKDISKEIAFLYVAELVESQILVSELEPSVSGKTFLSQLTLTLLEKKKCRNELYFLKEMKTRFLNLDENIVNPVKRYFHFIDFVKKGSTPVDIKYLFQTNLEITCVDCSLSKKSISDVKKALLLFNKISMPKSETNLEIFKRSFHGRYENREISLSKVFDTETGLRFPEDIENGDINPLIDDIILPSKSNQFKETKISWNKVYNILEEKLNTALGENKYSITLKDEDFEDFKANWKDLPDTIACMIELVTINNKEKIKVSGFGGSSAANLLARFCLDGEEIRNFVRQITDMEQIMNPDVILAEIIHLPKSRTGNILTRPHLRTYEIPYLAKSSLEKKFQINVNDLFLSLKENRFVLRSKRLNKEVIPHLTNAHNFKMNSLPMYHFLCDMQTQGLRDAVSFNFGPTTKSRRFLPRVEYENLILQEANWNFRKEDIASLLNSRANLNEFKNEIKKFRLKWKLPRLLVLVDGDNKLLINLDNLTSVEILIESVKNAMGFTLAENLHHEEGFVESKNSHYANEIILTFYNEEKFKA